MIATLLVMMLGIASQAGDPPEQPDREVIFARESQAGWSMEGRTIVDEGSPGREGFPATEPTIREMFCVARRNGIEVRLWRVGGLGMDIRAGVTGNGRERRLRPYDLRSLVLDGATWEVRTFSNNDFTERFTDAAYPEPELGPANVRDRQLGVRRPPVDTWLPIGVLANDLLRARLLRLGFREEVRNPEAFDDPMIWIDVPLDGLPSALNWCQRAMASPNALRLHPEGVAPATPRRP